MGCCDHRLDAIGLSVPWSNGRGGTVTFMGSPEAYKDLLKSSHPSPPRLTGSKPHDEERVKVLWGALRSVQELRSGIGTGEVAFSSKPSGKERSRTLRSAVDDLVACRDVSAAAATDRGKRIEQMYDATDVSAKLAAIDRLDPILIAEREAKRDEDVAACRANRIAELKERLADTQSEIERLEGEVADGD